MAIEVLVGRHWSSPVSNAGAMATETNGAKPVNGGDGMEDKRVPQETISATEEELGKKSTPPVQVKVDGGDELPYPVSHGITSAGAPPSASRTSAFVMLPVNRPWGISALL
jgi:hypothetical protein